MTTRRGRWRGERLKSCVRTDPDDLPPFFGVPIPIKDLTPVAGWPVTYGSWGAPEGLSEESALVVEAFERGGFVLTGRTNTPEFGPLTASENLRYGVTRNPWNPDRTAGRLERRSRRGDGGRDVSAGPRQRRWRINTYPGVVLRAGGAQGQPWSDPGPLHLLGRRRGRGGAHPRRRGHRRRAGPAQRTRRRLLV